MIKNKEGINMIGVSIISNKALKKRGIINKPTYDELAEALIETHKLYIEVIKDKYSTHDVTRIMANERLIKNLIK